MRKGFLVVGLLMLAAVAPASASGDVLYDQTGSPSGNFINASGGVNENADDFVVPAGEEWTITTVGAALSGPGFTAETVTFYSDDGTGTGPTTGSPIASRSATTSGVLSSAVSLNPGHYWVSAIGDGLTGWTEQSAQANAKAVRDDGGADCARWSVLQDCVSGHGPDMTFSLTGTSDAATPIEVNTLEDQSGGGSECSLREALGSANSDAAMGSGCTDGAGDDTITFSPSLGANPEIDLTVGELFVNSAVDVVGPGDLTVVAAGGNRVLHSNGSLPVSISGLELTGADTEVLNANWQGGGILNDAGAPLTLTDVLVDGNSISAFGNSSDVTLEGGGIYSTGNLTLNDTVVSGNFARGDVFGDGRTAHASGGGIAMDSPGTLVIHNSTISENEASAENETDGGPTAGGAIADSAGVRALNGATIDHSTISDNLVSAAFSGATVPDPAVTSNASAGGLRVSGGLTMELSTVNGNRAEAFGTATNGQSGGGIISGGGNIWSSTIAGNGANNGDISGSNIDKQGSSSVINAANTIVSYPRGDNQSNCFSTNGPPTLTSAGAGVDFSADTGPSCFTLPNPLILTTDPQLGPLQDNGGLTDTMLPANTSPVLDQGRASDQTDDTEDQRGLTRPVDFSGLSNPVFSGADGADIGAVEVQQPICPAVALPGDPCPVSGGGASTPPPVAGPTGQRAAALKKCKKKRTKQARKRCRNKARKLPV